MSRLHEQFLCDKFYLTIFIFWGKPRLHEQFLCDKFYFFTDVNPVYTNKFYLKTKEWRLGPMDDIKKIVNFMRCLVYMENFLYVTIFICHIKTNMTVFQQVQLSYKNWSFCSSTPANKNCHIKIVRVDGA